MRTFLAVILRCVGVLVKAVFRADNNAHHVNERAEKQEKKGEIIQRHMSGAAPKKQA